MKFTVSLLVLLSSLTAFAKQDRKPASDGLSEKCLKTLHSVPKLHKMIIEIEDGVKSGEFTPAGAAALIHMQAQLVCEDLVPKSDGGSFCEREFQKISFARSSIEQEVKNNKLSFEGGRILLNMQDNAELGLKGVCNK